MLARIWKSASVRSVLEGRSFIDEQRLNIKTLESAEAFLDCYGYRWQNSHDRAAIDAIRLEAIALIQQELLDPEEAIPTQIIDQDDVRILLTWTSQNEQKLLADWSCALLRVMHTLAHSQSYLNDVYQKEIRQQILSRFLPYIVEEEGLTKIGDIPIVSFECRPEKSRRSVALKLLHKTENVAADIFDWVGIRFVTFSRLDVLKLISFLRQHNMVMFANVKPSRSRNTLLNLDCFYQPTGENLSEEELDQLLKIDENQIPTGVNQANRFSETSYQSVQFTCRQRVRVFDKERGEICFFFPFEIQLIDEQSFKTTRSGRASHADYKIRQRAAIRRRVLPHLLNQS
jgi:uncharacterized protein (TIGR04562 family)